MLFGRAEGHSVCACSVENTLMRVTADMRLERAVKMTTDRAICPREFELLLLII